MLLLQLEHFEFDAWFIRLFQQGLLPEGFFRIADLRAEYLRLCWREEQSWKEWCENAA